MRKDFDLEETKKQKENKLKTYITQLEIVATNFHDSINIKGFFKDIQDIIREEGFLNKIKQEEAIQKIEEIALLITSKQQTILERVGIKKDYDIDLEIGEIGNESYTEEVEIRNIKYTYTLQRIGKDIQNKKIYFHITIIDKESGEKSDCNFWISYFDFPMINNIYLSKKNRCSVVLKNMNSQIARVTLIFFPEAYSGLKEKIYYDDIITKLIA